ncbi:hypothetical protein TCAL_15069 [Tigriopus californicus]|uniref:ELP1 first N-terminal beta-propeller domain-containing protein n=1 Tax=Tigriopus californicus TaxID=6832 RepID=A0A553NK50_TIGCA|nr:hypothetical protein TCAL_15069 [Tigriopus californicus]
MGFEVQVSRGFSQSNLAFHVNVDAKVLKITPFRQMVVPPPMSAFEVHFDGYIKSVVFFEKNGLRHGEIVLNFHSRTEARVTQLAWNKTSEVLAVLATDYLSPDEPVVRILLYTCSNYHWSLKQAWSTPQVNLLHFEWDAVDPLR